MLEGKLNITCGPEIVGDRKGQGISMDVQLKIGRLEDKFMLIHKILEALEFDDKDIKLLGLACAVNFWPDTDCNQEKIQVERGAFKNDEG